MLPGPSQPTPTSTTSFSPRKTLPAPLHATRVLNRDGVSVYVRDVQKWKRDQEPGIPRVVVSPLYEPILRRTYQFFRDYAAHGDADARQR